MQHPTPTSEPWQAASGKNLVNGKVSDHSRKFALNDKLRECATTACPFHDAGAGCRFLRGVRASEVTRVLDPIPVPCPLLTSMERSLRRYNRDPLDEPYDELPRYGGLILTVFESITRLDGAGSREVNHRYVYGAVLHKSGEEHRKLRGRKLCGECLYYGRRGQTCFHRDNRYSHALRPDTAPAKLDPPCGQFQSQRNAVRLPAGLDLAEEEKSEQARVWVALERLRHLRRDLHAFIVERFVQQRSKRELRAQMKQSRARVNVLEREAIHELRLILEDLA